MKQNIRPAYDDVITLITDYVVDTKITSEEAYKTAKLCLMDSLGCAMLALNFPACHQRLGPIVPGAQMEQGARVPGTDFQLDPVQAAFNFGAMIRWLDYNDTWLAAEWGHPSDNLGGILMVADYLSQQGQAINMHQVLTAMIKAHEIQGVLALNHAFNRVGLDHVMLVKIATTAVVTHMLGGDKEIIKAAISNAWLDGQSLRTYRHTPNTGPRKSWAAGDATARGVWLSFMAMRGELGYPSAITADIWGFQDSLFRGEPIKLAQPLASYVMENVLFKVSFPAEFHAQTAVEAAIQLHPQVQDKLEQIEKITLRTQEPAMRIINKSGPLHNPADRDHCLQYMTAIGLLFGDLRAEHYEDDVANDPRVDALRNKMVATEAEEFSADYLDPAKRAIGNAVQIYFQDGSSTEEIRIDYPLGHRRRREESISVLNQKFVDSIETRFDDEKAAKIVDLFQENANLENLSVESLVSGFRKMTTKSEVS